MSATSSAATTAATTSAPAAPTTAAAAPKKFNGNTTASVVSLVLPANMSDAWSAFYVEAEDTIAEFAGFAAQPAAAGGVGGRQLSARQISGQFEEEVARSWDEDWEDEDPDDTFDAIMGRVARSKTAANAVSK